MILGEMLFTDLTEVRKGTSVGRIKKKPYSKKFVPSWEELLAKLGIKVSSASGNRWEYTPWGDVLSVSSR
jgi:hypothetical protein